MNNAEFQLDSGSSLGKGSQESGFSRHIPVGSHEVVQGQHFDKDCAGM